MTKGELKCFVALIDLVLHQSETQSSMARVMLQRFENVDVVQKLRNELAGVADEKSRIELCCRVQALEGEAIQESLELSIELEDAIAREQTAGEQVEAIVAHLKNSLED